MALCIYNTYSRKIEEFSPREKKRVRLYTCGPTVYASPHIGNYRTYVTEDVFRRHLQYRGFSVRHVMNITDLDDIVLLEAKRRKMKRKALARMYERKFLREMRLLGNLRAHRYPRASEHVPEMIKLASRLVKNNHAYLHKDGNVYFDISKFPKYGRLSNYEFTPFQLNRRVKKNDYWQYEAGDFALWRRKSARDDETWECNFGRGRPAWNLECPAMAMHYLGKEIDLHMGGIDNIFSHHENEIAIAESATGRRFVRHWAHVKHLLLNGRKMSKSSGNFVTLEQLLSKGYAPRAIRASLLCVHYRDRLHFSFSRLDECAEKYAQMQKKVAAIKKASGRHEDMRRVNSLVKWETAKFEQCMDDDINAPGALSHVRHLINSASKLAKDGRLGKKGRRLVLRALKEFDSLLGCVPG
jgi:cysteinyl-tRNA synthetase